MSWLWIAAATLAAWAPVAWVGTDALGHARYLVVLPALLARHHHARGLIDWMAGELRARRVVREAERPALARAAALGKLPRATVVVLAACAYAVLPFVGERPASAWERFVSLPLLMTVVWSWLLSLILWGVFAARVSRLDLDLEPPHPDAACGLGFLSISVETFRPLMFAFSALLAARMLREIENSAQIAVPAALVLALGALVIVAPLFCFVDKIVRAKDRGKREYGLLMSGVIRRFERGLLDRDLQEADRDELAMAAQILDSGGVTFDYIRRAKLVPVANEGMARLVISGALPWIPLLAYTAERERLAKILKMILEVFFGGAVGFLLK